MEELINALGDLTRPMVECLIWVGCGLLLNMWK
jgi:hypothetical protein